MSEPTDATKAIAEAVKSVSDTTRKGMELAEKAGAFFVRVLGNDVAGIMQDKMFCFRAVNAVRLQDKLDRFLEERHIRNPKAIPLRLAIPFLEAATLEDDETLQECWARLLANAMDPRLSHELHRQFGEILKVLSPLDCHLLEAAAQHVAITEENRVRPELMAERLGISGGGAKASIQRLRSLGLLEDGIEVPVGTVTGGQPFYQDRNLHHITEWGRMFLAAIADTNDRERS